MNKNDERYGIAKLLPALPTLVTLSSLFCGFYSMIQSALAASGDEVHLTKAAMAIFFAMIFDGLDGRVARLTRTQSAFGVQIDSLADLVSFGAAPALLVYEWALAPIGIFGIIAAFLFLACGALRLARFNVLADKQKENEQGSLHYFIGLPIPAPAGLLALLVLVHQQEPGAVVHDSTGVAACVVVLAYLMVSNVRYRNFKHVPKVPLTWALSLTLALAFSVLALVTSFWFMVLSVLAAYTVMGPTEELLLFKHRRECNDDDTLSDIQSMQMTDSGRNKEKLEP
ncbi:MAG: CDP-diacylglycerol--serine O-phosphatidyltransferase [Deltaproteobacteria bacterium]|nr:CDP-diacylglycerol--serine O-phosphatidyltransferase [Deltaproteobacteria bacterium]